MSSFKWKINEVRRNIMRGLTRGIGASSAKKYAGKEKPELKRILISRPNSRLGNLLLITPLVQEVISICPDCKIDLFVRGNLVPLVFGTYDNIDRVVRLPKKPFKQLPRYIYTWFLLKRRRYDLVINVVKTSSSGRLSVFFATSRLKFFGDDTFETALSAGYLHVAKYPVYNLRNFLNSVGYDLPNRPVPLLDIKLSEEELQRGSKELEAITHGSPKKTICIFTNATAGKKFSEEWWGTFYAELLIHFPDYTIIEALPVENISQINFKAPSYYTKDVRELGAFIASCDLFIGADSGIMHLASAVHTTTIGLFSVTSADAYGPYGNGSTCIDTTKGAIDDWMRVIDRALSKP